jgi:uncharacterized protein YkwD
VDQFMREIEVRRAAVGCKPLTRSSALQSAAMDHALALWSEKGSLSHVDNKGATAQDRASRLGYPGSVVEVVANGSEKVSQVVGAFDWVMTDSDLLDCKYKSSGAAVVSGYWVLVLGTV